MGMVGDPKKYMVIPSATYFGTALVFVALPLLIVDLGGSVAEYAILNLVYNSVYALSSWYLPSVLRGYSRKYVLVVSYATLSLLSIAIALTRCIWLLIAIQIPYAIALAISTIVQTNVFVELWRGRKGITVLYIATSMGWIASLAIGSFLRRYLELSTILYISAIGFGIASMASLTLPEIVGVVEAQRVITFRMLYRWVIEKAKLLNVFASPRPSLRVGKLSTVKLFLLAVTLTFIAAGAFFTSIPVYLKKVCRFPDHVILALSMTAGLSSFTLYFLQLRLSENLDLLWRIHIASLSLRTALFITPIAIDRRIPLFFALYSALGATWAFIGSVQNIIASSIAPPHRKDEVIGNVNASMSIGLSIGYTLALLSEIVGYSTVFTVASIMVGLAAILNVEALKRWRIGII